LTAATFKVLSDPPNSGGVSFLQHLLIILGTPN
jgi:hypothetical protein